MLEPIVVSGREFRPEVLQHLNELARQRPPLSNGALAREVCAALAWFSPDGRPALSSAKAALRKLEKRGLLAPLPCGPRNPNRLRPSGQDLPPLTGVPARANQVRGLFLYLVSGPEDPRQRARVAWGAGVRPRRVRPLLARPVGWLEHAGPAGPPARGGRALAHSDSR